MRPTKPKRELLSEIELLQAALRFSDADLEMNRQGILSEAQRQILRRNQLNWMIGGAVGLGVVGWLAIALWSSSDLVGKALLLLSTVLIAPAIFYILIIRKWQRFAADLRLNEVAVVQGLVILDIVEKSSPNYYLKVGGLTFAVNKATFYAFKNRDLYNVYYMPHSRTLLSAEPLSQTFKSTAD